MAYVRTTWTTGDVITASLANNWEGQFAAARSEFTAGNWPNWAGTEAARPAHGITGRVYIATDTRRIWRDTGTAWAEVVTPAGIGATPIAHESATAAHSATPAPTANRIVLRDAAGRAQVAAPSAAADIARLDTVTGYAVNRAGDTMTGTLIAPNVLWGTNNSRGILLMNGTNLNDIVVSGWYDGDNLLNRPAGTLWGHVMVSIGHSHLWVMQIFLDLHNENDYFIRRSFEGGGGIRAWTPWRRIWHEGNDGIGSGLDAGLLEGYNGASYGKWVAIGNTIMLEALTERSTFNESMTMIKSFETSRPGQFRVTGEIACFNSELNTKGTVELRNNAGNTISASFITWSSNFVNFTLDTNIIFPRMPNIINLFYANAIIRNVRLRGDDSPGTPTRVLLN